MIDGLSYLAYLPIISNGPHIASDASTRALPSVPSDIRTNWDYAVAREDYMQMRRGLYDRKQLTRCEFRERELVSRHEATVRDEDSHHNQYEMKSTLDFDLLRDTMQVKTYTVHDLTKRIEKLHDQTVQMARHIGDFSKEHSGIWVYPSGADTERQYSADYAERLSRPEAHSITASAERKNETRPRNARKSPGHNPTTQRRHQRR